MKNMKKVLPS